MKDEISIYQTENGNIEVKVDPTKDTVWLRQIQMAELFGRERSVITKHIKNLFDEKELDEKSNVQNMHFGGSDKPVKFYSLDVIISVGYRVKSQQGTRFRQWATNVLREHLLKGYTINQQRFETNAHELEAALTLIKRTMQNPRITSDEGRGLADIVSRYAQTFLWLQRYDEGLLSEPIQQQGGVLPTVDEAKTSLANLKKDLIARKEATTLFAQERGDAFEALLGNLDQTLFGNPAYILRSRQKQHTFYILLSRIILLPMVIKEVVHFYSSIFYIVITDYLMITSNQLSMILV